MLRSRTALTVTLAALLGAGCTVMSTESDEAWRKVPGWLAELREVPETIAQLDTANEPAGPLPVAERFVVRGTPQDMTAALREVVPPRRQQEPQPRPVNGDNRPSVVVNLNGPGASESAAAPDPGAALSRLEKLYASTRAGAIAPVLRQFGYDQLRRGESEVESGPVPDDYIVGPGDELTIAISGSFTASHRAEIDRDGRIRLPDVGAVALAGRPFRELETVIRAAYAQQRRGFDVSVGMGRLRRVAVQVIGNVERPGAVEISALGTALTALRAAGGVTKDGALRRIQVRRPGQPELEIDVYDFLLSGDGSAIPVLGAGAVVFVPTVETTFAVRGAVLRPGIYERRVGDTLATALQLGGGISGFAFADRVQIEGTHDGRRRTMADVGLGPDGLARSIADTEVVIVGEVDDRQGSVVEIVGEVGRPGTFEHKPGLRISDVVRFADGPTILAHTQQVFVSRVVAAPGSVQLTHSGRRAETTRRVLVVDLDKALQGDADHDIELAPLDLVTVRSRQNAVEVPTVSVIGAVRAAGIFELTAGLRVSDLVALAGNLRPEVYYPEAELIRWHFDAAGRQLQARRYRFHLGRALDAPGSHEDPILENGDRLVVRALRKVKVEVEIRGEVRFPGKYVFGRDAKITDLIAAAGGAMPEADLRLARFSRRSVAELQTKRLRHLAERTRRVHESALETMVQTGTPAEGLAAKIALENTKEVLDRISRQEADGRIVLPFLRHDFPASAYNLALENGDVLTIPRRQHTVTVLGHVFNPGSFVAADELTVADVVDWSGGLTEAGDDQRLYVIRGTGRVQSLAQASDPLRMRTRLLPGDVVLVPRRPLERTLGARIADLIHVTRQLSEIGVLANNIATGGSLDVTAVIQHTVRDVLQGSAQPLLQPGR
ncbi:MAG: SLBB domain-containing protein [bacterium]|nr:SLBB domain-containing protein [bacterium]